MKVKNAGKYALPLGAAGAFLLCLWTAYLDKTATATLLAGLFCICVLFVYFPQLESFKAFTVEAKLRERVDEAKGLLNTLAEISIASSRFIYLTMQADTKDQKSDWLARSDLTRQINQVLTGLDVSEQEIASIRGEFFTYIRPKIFAAYNNVVTSLVFDHNIRKSAILEKIREEKPTDYANDEEYKALATGSTVSLVRGVPDEFLADKAFGKKIDDIYSGFFTREEIDALVKFNKEFYDAYHECIEAGYLTRRAAELILKADDRGWQVRQFKELFAREPAPLVIPGLKF